MFRYFSAHTVSAPVVPLLAYFLLRGRTVTGNRLQVKLAWQVARI